MNNDNKVMVRFLSNYDQEFTGTDLRAYGPFKEGEIIRMPPANAEVLAKKDYVKIFGN